MSVDFDLRGARWEAEAGVGPGLPPAGMFVNMANANARDFLAWLGLRSEAEDPGLCGEMRAPEFAAVLRRALQDAGRVAADKGRFGVVEGRWVECGRPAGRFVEAAGRLLALAEHGGELGVVVWG